MSTIEEIDGEELKRTAEELDDWTFIYAVRNNDGRYERMALFLDQCLSAEMAEGRFWLQMIDEGYEPDVDPNAVLLSCCLAGRVMTVDTDQALCDEPSLPDPWWEQELDRYSKSALPRNPYTVFAVWESEAHGGFKRSSESVDAVDPVHAQLLSLIGKGVGTYLICGVVDLKVDPADATEGYLEETDSYAYRGGTFPEVLAPEPPRKGFLSRWLK